MEKARVTLLMIVVLTIALVGLSGCAPTPGERISQLNSMIAQAQQMSASYDAQMGNIVASMPGLEQAMADGNLPPELRQKAIEAMASLKAKLTTLQQGKIKVDEALANYQKAIQSVDMNTPNIGTELQIYGTGVQQISPMLGPYAGYAYLIGWILTAIGGGIAVQKNSANSKALDQVVTGNQLYMDANPTAAPVLKATQSQVQTQDTVNKVAAIKLS